MLNNIPEYAQQSQTSDVIPLGNSVNGPTYPGETTSQTVRVIGTTRTLGYWQTHTSFTTAIFTDYLTVQGNNFIGQNVPVVPGTHKGILTSTSQVFGGFYAPIAKTSTGTKRTPGDQARITLLQQLLAANYLITVLSVEVIACLMIKIFKDNKRF